MNNPVLNLKAFSIGQFSIGAILVMINFGITLYAMFILPQYLQNALLLPVALTVIVMLPGGVINTIISLCSGMLYDKIGAKIPVTLGFILSIIGTILLIMTNSETSIAYVIMCHIIVMIGVPLAMSPAQSSGLKSLPANMFTYGSTILNTMQQVWGAICTAVATSLLGIGQSFYNGSDNAVSFLYGSRFGFGFALCLAVFGFIISLFLKNTKKAGN